MTYPPNIVHNSPRSLPTFNEGVDAAPSHFVKVGHTVYGPFTGELMERFVEENRIGPQTLISDQAYGTYHPASDTADFGKWEHAIKTKRYAGQPLPTVFLIVADIQPFKKREFLIVLKQIGQCQQITESAWVLLTETDIRFVREALSRNLSEADRLFIHDSFSNSAGWFNLDDGVDKAITSMWKDAAQTRKNIKTV